MSDENKESVSEETFNNTLDTEDFGSTDSKSVDDEPVSSEEKPVESEVLENNESSSKTETFDENDSEFGEEVLDNDEQQSLDDGTAEEVDDISEYEKYFDDDYEESSARNEELTQRNLDDYFDEDEEILKGTDRALLEERSLAIFQQHENVVSWEIEGLLIDNRLKKARELKTDPPIFKVSSSDGASAEFLLTKELSKSMANALNDVYKAYYGVDTSYKRKPMNQETMKSNMDGFVEWMEEHKLLTVLIAIMVLMVLYSIIFS